MEIGIQIIRTPESDGWLTTVYLDRGNPEIFTDRFVHEALTRLPARVTAMIYDKDPHKLSEPNSPTQKIE